MFLPKPWNIEKEGEHAQNGKTFLEKQKTLRHWNFVDPLKPPLSAPDVRLHCFGGVGCPRDGKFGALTPERSIWADKKVILGFFATFSVTKFGPFLCDRRSTLVRLDRRGMSCFFFSTKLGFWTWWPQPPDIPKNATMYHSPRKHYLPEKNIFELFSDYRFTISISSN